MKREVYSNDIEVVCEEEPEKHLSCGVGTMAVWQLELESLPFCFAIV